MSTARSWTSAAARARRLGPPARDGRVADRRAGVLGALGSREHPRLLAGLPPLSRDLSRVAGRDVPSLRPPRRSRPHPSLLRRLPGIPALSRRRRGARSAGPAGLPWPGLLHPP